MYRVQYLTQGVWFTYVLTCSAQYAVDRAEYVRRIHPNVLYRIVRSVEEAPCQTEANANDVTEHADKPA